MFCASFLEKFVGIIKEKGHLNWMDEISISFSITYFWDIKFPILFLVFDKISFTQMWWKMKLLLFGISVDNGPYHPTTQDSSIHCPVWR